MSFTPGTWIVDENGNVAVHWYGGRYITLAVVRKPDYHEDNGKGREEADANARLMKAAPLLLAACQSFVKALKRDRVLYDFEEQAIAAIAAALPPGAQQ